MEATGNLIESHLICVVVMDVLSDGLRNHGDVKNGARTVTTLLRRCPMKGAENHVTA